MPGSEFRRYMGPDAPPCPYVSVARFSYFLSVQLIALQCLNFLWPPGGIGKPGMIISPPWIGSCSGETSSQERLNQWIEGHVLSAKDPHSNQLIRRWEEIIGLPYGRQQCSNSNLSSS